MVEEGEVEAGEVGARKTPRAHLGEEGIVLYMQALCDSLQMVCMADAQTMKASPGLWTAWLLQG